MESFDDFVRELEARATDEERAMLNEARAHALARLEQAKRKIERRERIDRYVDRMTNEYGTRAGHLKPIVALHQWPESPFNHDGPCVEIAPRHCGGMRFTTLL